jgi:hypothetical protein
LLVFQSHQTHFGEESNLEVDYLAGKTNSLLNISQVSVKHNTGNKALATIVFIFPLKVYSCFHLVNLGAQ